MIPHGCPCGYYGHPEKECTCTPYAVQKYMGKISGPLLDRIDMHVQVPALTMKELTLATASGEHSSEIQKRVQRAREIQSDRIKQDKVGGKKSLLLANAHLSSKQIKKYCVLDRECGALLEGAITHLGLSARAYDRILKVSRTVADLEQCNSIKPSHIAEAIQYRTLDKSNVI